MAFFSCGIRIAKEEGRDQTVHPFKKDRIQEMANRVFTQRGFTEEVLENDKPSVVMFETGWSGACHIVGPVLDDLGTEYETKVNLLRLDAEENGWLIDAYGIRAFPTLHFFTGGQIVHSLTGIVSRQELKAKLDSLIHISMRISQ